MDTITSILLVGVGGQGVLRASDILSEALMEDGQDVKKSEVHGMAQRGGSVTSFVRFGEKVYSPTAAIGEVTILMAFEKMEVLRYINFLVPNGIIIINDETINPPACNLGVAEYPNNIDVFIKKVSRNYSYIPATDIAQKAGSARATNTVLLGALANHLSLSNNLWKNVLKKSFPEKLLNLNFRAFEMGKAYKN